VFGVSIMDIGKIRVTDSHRIVLGDDNPAILDTVKRMLEGEFQVVAAIQEPRAVIKQVPELNPDVLVLDISMGEMNGFEITRQLRADHCQTKIIILSVHEELEFIRAAFDAGASGYVFKSRINTDLRKAIDAVLNHKVFIPEAPIPQYGLSGSSS